jgi:hypothetical protein
MRQLSIVFVSLMLLAATNTFPEAPAESPYGAPPGSTSRIYHIEYLRTFPGKSDDYDKFIKTVFRPMLDGMVARGIWLKYSFLTVPYHGVAPCSDYTHVFVAQLPDFAALDREQKVWGELAKKFHPDEAERKKRFEEELLSLREMVREEFLQDFDWK